MRSDEVKKGFNRAPHRSLLRATGLKDEDFEKPYLIWILPKELVQTPLD